MRNWKSYSMALAFVALCATSVSGCDLSQTVADIIAGALGGNGGCIGGCAAGCGSCGSCGDCASCASCASCTDCGGCAGCAVDCDPVLRNLAGKNEGFNGTGTGNGSVHPNRRIANAVQMRLTSTGFTFLRAQVPSLVTGLLGTGGIALPGSLAANGQSPGKIYLELRNFNLLPVDGGCNGNAGNGYGAGHDCIRATLNAYFRTCDNNAANGCTAGETVPVSVDAPVVGRINCNLNIDAGRGTHTNGLELRADVGTLNDTAPAAHAGYSRVAILDADVTNTATLEGADIQVSCPNVSNSITWAAACAASVFVQGVSINCGFLCAGGSCSINPNGLVGSAIDDLRNDINDIVDAQLNANAPKLCQAAQNANDCPTGSTYAAPATGPVSASNPGSCTITGSNPARCVEILLGAEARIGLGAAEAVVSPGIEATIDFLLALAGEGETFNNGINARAFLGMESWVAGIRGLRHNPCVPIEHPAANQAECDAIGSGWQYEGVMQDGATNQGRCVPRIPVIPSALELRENDPQAVSQDSADANAEASVGISESFISYAAWKLWDSGALCLNVGSWLDPTLSPSLLSFALLDGATTPRLFFPLVVNADDPNYAGGNANKSSVALMLHPQTPPVISLDETVDPCDANDNVLNIDVAWDNLQIDLSIWNDDRYARIGTIETDLHVVVALDVGAQAAAGSCPAIEAGGIGINIPTLAFADAHWLPDAPMLTSLDFRPGEFNGGKLPVQAGLDTVGGFAGGIVASLVKPIAVQTLINNALSAPIMGTQIPIRVRLDPDAFQVVTQSAAPCSGPPYDMGVRGVDNSCDYNFLTIYADLTDANGVGPLTGSIDTSVEVTHVTKPTDPALYELQSATFGQGELPSVEIAMTASGPNDAQYEYSYRTSYTGWSAWQSSPYAVIRDPSLLVQGHQQVFAIARIAGNDSSADTTSATADLVIDASPPMIQLYERADGAQLQALDLVSDSLEYRVQEPGEDFGSWQALPASGVKNLAIEDGSVVEVRDEDGNVGSSAQTLQGRPNAANSSACGTCSTTGAQSETPNMAIFGGLMVLGAFVARRRRHV